MKQLLIKHKWSIGFWILGTIVIPLVFIHITTPKPRLGFYLGNTFSFERTDDRIDSLAVIYRHHNIAKDSMNVLWMTIDIENMGSGDIREADYTSEPFGLKVRGCSIITVRPLDTSSNHLARIIKPRIVSPTSVEFNKIAFDSHEKVRLLVYMLYKWNHSPTEEDFIPVGKITGEKSFTKSPQSDEDSTIDDVIEFLKIVGVELVIILPPLFGLYFLQKRYRRWRISRRLNPNAFRPYTDIEKVFIEVYVKLGRADFLKLVKGLLRGDEYLNEEKNMMDAYDRVNTTRQRKALFIFSRQLFYQSPFVSSYDIFKKHDVIKEQDGKYSMTAAVKEEVEKIRLAFTQPL